MRYIKWIFLLLVVIFIFLQLLANLDTLSTNLSLVLKFPGTNGLSLNFKFLSAAIVLFSSGFILAILIEIYSWYKYSRTIRQQNKMIKTLREKIENLEPGSTLEKTMVKSSEDARGISKMPDAVNSAD